MEPREAKDLKDVLGTSYERVDGRLRDPKTGETFRPISQRGAARATRAMARGKYEMRFGCDKRSYVCRKGSEKPLVDTRDHRDEATCCKCGEVFTMGDSTAHFLMDPHGRLHMTGWELDEAYKPRFTARCIARRVALFDA
jgi:hypothetical protein